MQDTSIDLRDELLAKIFQIVQEDSSPVLQKVKTLARAGRIAESYIGVLGGHESGVLSAFSVSSETLISQAE